MSMYTIIDIENPGTITDEHELQPLSAWGYEFERTFGFDGEPVSYYPNGTERIEGRSKSELDGVHLWAKAYTRIFPGSVVMIDEEWTGEGDPSKTYTVYEGGEMKPESSASSMMMPDNIWDLIRDVRACVDACERLVEGDSNDAEIDASFDLQQAATALVDAIHPNGAKK